MQPQNSLPVMPQAISHPEQTQSTPTHDLKTAASINFSSLQLMNSTKGLLDSARMDAKTIIGLVIVLVIGAAFGGFMGGAIALVVGFFGYVAKLQAERNSRLWKQFAQDNGWQVGPAQFAEAVVPPTISSRGHSRKISDVVSGSFSGNVFKCYVYNYTVGRGKNSTTYTQTIIQIVLQKPLPSFLLDSAQASVIHDMPSQFVHVSLEGDFDKSFKLYAPKEATTDVLSVISPDVMHTLVQKNTFQDIQSEGGSVWFMQVGDTRQQEKLPALFIAIEGLMPEFYHRLKSYQVTNAAAHIYSGNTLISQHTYAPITSVPVTKNKFHIVFLIFVVFFMMTVFGFMIMVFTGIQ